MTDRPPAPVEDRKSTAAGEPRAGVAADERHCGYVALVGRPNVGKSTLLNRLLGLKLSIVTAKPQTTRQRLAGIKTTTDGQVVYVDTPGIHRAAGQALNRHMNRVAHAALRDVDVVLFLVEAERWTREDDFVARALLDVNVPVLLVVNKIDQVPDKSRLLAWLAGRVDAARFEHVLLVSARRGAGVAELERKVLALLPFSRPLYDEDQFTDRSERFLAAELVREQLMERLHQEVPYALTVEVEEFNRDGELLRIGAIVWVERASQKQIVIGKGGRVLKQVGTAARQALEILFDQKIYLRLWVKVRRDWTDDEQALRELGFDDAAG